MPERIQNRGNEIKIRNLIVRIVVFESQWMHNQDMHVTTHDRPEFLRRGRSGFFGLTLNPKVDDRLAREGNRLARVPQKKFAF
jgi:hypothetical protein